ncbi:beta-1,6-N-acetylglucosaminyltransferase [Aerococcus urinaeequi]|uniref:beta-1,6-N-acetylglucosaminyltransferase n=1 Tax=Aerococcus urinaeequi TaxID=51665 RepID=UPI0022807243|nr:beta-1,6-N-acetylglucosaminyltransferase [Aerococcus urinaeequi]MCY7731068.1 beta-1,6-N-acetylglucosaminyltransferase [Aerococcus urinaeequi]
MKHAFLIMAHENTETFQTLIKQIDHENIDIFIHMDSKNKRYSVDQVQTLVKHSRVFHTDRLNVSWGGFSQIKAELALLKLATSKSYYSYYHLLSGQDLLISSLDDFFNFFNSHQGTEFINFEAKDFKYQDRVKYYSIQDAIGRKKLLTPLKLLNKMSIAFQQILKVNRNSDISFQKGDNWFSITDDLARYVLSKESWIFSVFKNTEMSDEIFLQTIVHNSSFKSELYLNKYDNKNHNILREIDWNRGMPYTYQIEDFEILKKSPNFFARKFNENLDDKIIKTIYAHFH